VPFTKSDRIQVQIRKSASSKGMRLQYNLFLTVYQSSLLTYSPLMYRFLELYHVPVWTNWTSFNESEIRNISPYCLNRAVNLMNATLVAADPVKFRIVISRVLFIFFLPLQE